MASSRRLPLDAATHRITDIGGLGGGGKEEFVTGTTWSRNRSRPSLRTPDEARERLGFEGPAPDVEGDTTETGDIEPEQEPEDQVEDEVAEVA